MKKLMLSAVALFSIVGGASAIELVYNGDFSIGPKGADGWTEYSAGGFPLIDYWTEDDPIFGTGSAWLGGYDDAVDSIAQTTVDFGTLPGTATLTFDALFASSDDPTYDFFYVGFAPSDIRLTEDIAVESGFVNSYTIDVSDLMGTGLQTLVFQVETDFLFSSTVFVDNISIQATPVPEPATMAIMGLGIASVAARRRKKA